MRLLTALWQVKAEESTDQDKTSSIATKMLRMKEDITKETVARSAAMQDKEERAALASAVAAIKRGDHELALKIMSARLSKVERRLSFRKHDSDSESEEDAEQECQKGSTRPTTKCGTEKQHVSTLGRPDTAGMTKQDWIQVAGGSLSILDEDAEARKIAGEILSDRPPEERMDELRRQLEATGFMTTEEPRDRVCDKCESILAGMKALRRAGVPAFFIWMYNEPWEVMRTMWRRAEALLGSECVLEPTVAAYHLDHKSAAAGGNAYVGTNFALPHRDYTYSDTYNAQGQPQLLTVWVPVSDITVDNGCMYVVPKEFDHNYDRDDVMEHMLVQSTGWLAGKSFLRFDYPFLWQCIMSAAGHVGL
jgi:hypothetical protein